MARTAARQTTATVRIRRCNRASLLQATALRAAFVVVFAAPAAAQLPPGARPTGGTVVGGQATFGQRGNTLYINQASERAAINWQSFNVGSQQTVDFVQPNGQAIALNTVIGANPSEIAGRIDANGQIVIVNQSGVIFDRGSQVDTEGLTVSAAGITNQNFMAGHMVFDQAPHPGAKITNAGTITVNQAGLAALVAPQVANSGVIQATLGRVILAGAATYTLDLYGDGLLALNVTGQVTNVLLNGQSVPALVTNQGVIVANGGTVMLTASAADGLIRTLVDAGGTIAANSVGSSTGSILVQGIGGSVEIDGNVTATGVAAGTRGGQVVADATGNVTVAGNATVDVSGDAGGGLIAIGTTAARGAGGPGAPSSMTAGTTTVLAGAVLRANATGSGQGGRVTLLSSEQTNFAGAISARGGAQGGHGGWIEVSSTGSLNFGGLVDASAPIGDPGAIVIDVKDLAISGTPITGFTTIMPGVVDAMKGAVFLYASDTLLLASAVTANAQATSLELDAGGSLILQASLNAGDLPVTLEAGTAGLMLQGGTVTAGALTLMSQGVITETGGAIDATSLTGAASGAVMLAGDSNDVGALGNFTATSGALVFDDAASLLVNGTVKAGGNVTIAVAGALNALTIAGDVTAAGTATLAASTLTLAATGNVAGSPIVLEADQFYLYGGIDAGTGLLAVDRFSTGALVVGDNPGDFRLDELASLAAGTLALGSRDGVTASAITTELDFDSAVDLTSLGVGTLGLFSSGLIIESGVDNSGGFTVSSLYGTAGTAILTYSNSVTTLDNFKTNQGGFDFNNDSSLTVAGTVTTATGDLMLTSTGALAITGTLSALKGVVFLTAGGDITETGAIDARSLTGSAGGMAMLTGSNDVGTLGGFTAGPGGLDFQDAANLYVTGMVASTGNVTLAVTGGTDGLRLAADITDADVTLSAPGSIIQTGGAITAALLGGSAGTGATLTSLANAVTTLGGFNAGSGAFLFDDNVALTVTGPIMATDATIAVSGSVGAVANALTLDGAITATDVTLSAAGDITQTDGAITATDVTLSAAGNITQNGGVITATALSGSAGGAVMLTGSNDVGTLGNFTAGGVLTFNDTSALTLYLDGAIAATDVMLLAASAIDQTGGGITANVLSGAAGGAVTLTSDSNDVAVLDDFTAGTGATDGFAFDDAASLAVNGNVQAGGNVTIAVAGALNALTVAADITAAGTATLAASTLTLAAKGNVAGAPIVLEADQFYLYGGIDAGTGLLAVDRFSTGALVVGDNPGDFRLDELASLAAGTLALGSRDGVTASAITTELDFDSAVDLTSLGVGTLGLFSSGLIIESGVDNSGGFTVSSLYGTAGTAILTYSNSVTTLDNFKTDQGGFDFNNDSSLTVAGTVTAAGDLTLTSMGGLEIAGTLSALKGLVTLTAESGDITESGAIDATALTGSASGMAMLTGSNDVGTLGGFIAGAGGFDFQDAANLSVTGTVAAGGSVGITLSGSGHRLDLAADISGTDVTLLAPGSITQSAGVVTANTTTIALTSSGGGISFGGTLNAATSVSLIAGGGSIAETANGVGGAIIASSLAGSASGMVALTGSNSIDTLDMFTAGTGAFTFDDAANLTVAGPVTGADVTIAVGGYVAGVGNALTLDGAVTATNALTLLAAGAIDQTGGAIMANRLTGSAGGAVTLDSATNNVLILENLAAGGGALSFNDASKLSVTGTVVADGSVAITTSGLLSVSGDIIATSITHAPTGQPGIALDATGGGISLSGTLLDRSGQVSLTAGDGNISENPGTGAIDAASLTGAATGAVTLASMANNVATLDAFTAGTGAFTFDDATSLTVAGKLSAGGSLTIAVAGANHSLTVASDVAGASVNLSAMGPIIEDQGVTIDAGAGAGALSMMAGTDIMFYGNLDGGAVTLIAGKGDKIGSITEQMNAVAEGVITATSLTGSALTGVTLNNMANSVATLDKFAAGDSAFIFDDAHNLSVNGSVSATGAVTIDVLDSAPNVTSTLSIADGITGTAGVDLSATGAITQTGGTVSGKTIVLDSSDGGISLGGLLDATTLVTLTASGDIDETGTGAIAATSLTGSTGGAVMLTGNNNVATLDAFTAGTGFAFNDAKSLTVAGPVNAGGAITIDVTGGTDALTIAGDITGAAVTLQAAGAITQNALTTVMGTTTNVSLLSGADILFNGTLMAINGQVSLAAEGNISESPGTGTIDATSLTGSAGGTATLYSATNTVGTLAGFTAGTGAADMFAFKDAHNLSVAGPVNAGGDITIALIDNTLGGTSTLTIADGIAGAAVNISATGDIDEIGNGAITANALTGFAGGAVMLTGKNDVATLDRFTAGTGTFTFADADNLTVAGPVTAADVTIAVSGFVGTTGNALTLEGAITATDAVALSAAGAIDQTGGVITANSLTGSAGGAVMLTGKNDVATLDAFTAGTAAADAFAFDDTQALTVDGAVKAGGSIGITLSGAGNALTLAGDITGSSVTLTTPGAISQMQASTVEATSGDVSLASTGANIAFGGTLTATGEVSLTADGGSIVETFDNFTGAIAATHGTLTGSATTGVTLDSATNNVATLGSFNAGSGAFNLRDNAALTIAGNVMGAGIVISATGGISQNATTTVTAMLNTDINLTSNAGIELDGTLMAKSGAVSLTALDGSINQGSSGVIAANALTGSATGAVILASATNAVAALNSFSAGTGSLVFDDATSLSVSGTVSAGPAGKVTSSDDVTIAVTGAGNTLDIGGVTTGDTVITGSTISLSAPSTVTMNNITINTASEFTPGMPKPHFPQLAKYGLFVTSNNFTQTGMMTVNAGGAAATVDITIAGTGKIDFDPFAGLIAPTTELFLNLAGGTTEGHIEVAGLNVSYARPGSPMLSNLTGTVGGLNGEPAAGRAYIVEDPTGRNLPNANYRLNNCALEAVDCILLSPVIVPVGNPIETFEVDTPRRRHADDDLVLPNVSEEDF